MQQQLVRPLPAAASAAAAAASAASFICCLLQLTNYAFAPFALMLPLLLYMIPGGCSHQEIEPPALRK
jgi:hypothetical protein